MGQLVNNETQVGRNGRVGRMLFADVGVIQNYDEFIIDTVWSLFFSRGGTLEVVACKALGCVQDDPAPCNRQEFSSTRTWKMNRHFAFRICALEALDGNLKRVCTKSAIDVLRTACCQDTGSDPSGFPVLAVAFGNPFLGVGMICDHKIRCIPLQFFTRVKNANGSQQNCLSQRSCVCEM